MNRRKGQGESGLGRHAANVAPNSCEGPDGVADHDAGLDFRYG